MRNVLNKSCRENQKAHFIRDSVFFRKHCLLRDNGENYCRAEQATDDNMTHVHCMLDT